MSGCAEGLNRREKRSRSEKAFRVLVESRLWIASRLNPWPGPGPGLRFNEHLHEHDGPLIFQHACRLSLEDIVSKRRNSLYRSGRSQEPSGSGGEQRRTGDGDKC
jgi:hypothetical protein